DEDDVGPVASDAWKRHPRWEGDQGFPPQVGARRSLHVCPPWAAPHPTFAAQAGRIDNIAPSCASISTSVTITGSGFGAGNVDQRVHVRRNIRLYVTPHSTRSCMTTKKRAEVTYLI